MTNWYKIAIKERIPGGRAEGVPVSDFNKKDLETGINIEKEHTSDPETAEEISKDHLSEFKNYYTELKKMENLLKENKELKKMEEKVNNSHLKVETCKQK